MGDDGVGKPSSRDYSMSSLEKCIDSATWARMTRYYNDISIPGHNPGKEVQVATSVGGSRRSDESVVGRDTVEVKLRVRQW